MCHDIKCIQHCVFFYANQRRPNAVIQFACVDIHEERLTLSLYIYLMYQNTEKETIGMRLRVTFRTYFHWCK